VPQDGFKLKSYQFRTEREKSWRELGELIVQIDRKGIRSLQSAELYRLPVLYRSAVSSLSVARAISLDRALVQYLEALVSRAYTAVYSCRHPARNALRQFFQRDLPRAVRQFSHQLGLACGILLLGTLCGLLLTLEDPNRFYTFIPSEMGQGRGPNASTQSLRESLYATGKDASELQMFATFLFTHNAKLAMLCFALGFAAGAPVVILLFYNGLILGSLAAVFQLRGLGVEFWGWVLPHGVTELGAICLCGAGGLALGQALIFPGQHSRLDNLAIVGRRAGVLVIGAVVMLVIAALIEGFFRQTVQNVTIRWLLATGSLFFYIWYFGYVGREHDDRTA